MLGTDEGGASLKVVLSSHLSHQIDPASNLFTSIIEVQYEFISRKLKTCEV